MATAMVVKFNTPENKLGHYDRVPRCLYKKGYAPSTVCVLGRIFSRRSELEQGSDEKVCRLSYAQARTDLGFSAPTVSRAFQTLKERREIKVAFRDKLGATYSCIEDYEGKDFDVVPEFLYHAEFLINGKMRRLTNAERRLLAHIMTFASYEKNAGTVEGSSRVFARKLKLAEKTVRSAIKTLLKAGLIYRRKEDKGVNAHLRSKYRPNKKLYEYKNAIKTRKKKATSQLPAAIEAANARAERESFYAHRRTKALNTADKWQEKAKEDPTYREIAEALAKMEIALAKAEVFNPQDLPKLKHRQIELLKQKKENLAHRDIREEYLLPKWHCCKCQDTGFLPGSGKACDCYKRE